MRRNLRDVFILFFLHMTFRVFDIGFGFRFTRLSEQVSVVNVNLCDVCSYLIVRAIQDVMLCNI